MLVDQCALFPFAGEAVRNAEICPFREWLEKTGSHAYISSSNFLFARSMSILDLIIEQTEGSQWHLVLFFLDSHAG